MISDERRQELRNELKRIYWKILREYPEVFREMHNPQIDKQIANEKRMKWIKLTEQQKKDMVDYAIALEKNENTIQSLEKVIYLDVDVTCIPDNLLKNALKQL